MIEVQQVLEVGVYPWLPKWKKYKVLQYKRYKYVETLWRQQLGGIEL